MIAPNPRLGVKSRNNPQTSRLLHSEHEISPNSNITGMFYSARSTPLALLRLLYSARSTPLVLLR